MKLRVFIAILIFGLFSSYAQSQSLSFFGHKLKNISDFSDHNLNDLGFYLNDDGFYYGGLWGVDVRLYIQMNENGSKIKELIFTTPYRENEYLGLSEGRKLIDSYTDKISKQLKSGNIRINVPTFGASFGNVIYCEDGYVSIFHDYASSTLKGPIIIRYTLME